MIQNTGPRVLKMVDINCVFYDPYGQVVLRQRVPIVGQKAGGLEAGATKPVPAALRQHSGRLEQRAATTGDPRASSSSRPPESTPLTLLSPYG